MEQVQNKNIQRQRTMRFFIDATKDIIKSEGIQRVTIRNVAELAGYNSATIYNYFENLDQLLAYAMIDSITEYLHQLNHIKEMKLDSLTTYLLFWRCYAECSFANPETFAYVFDSEDTNKVLSKIDEFYNIFSFDTEDSIPSQVVTAQNLKNRDDLIIAPCIEDGFIKETDKDYILDFTYVLHTGFLNRIIKGYYTNPSIAVNAFLDYIIEMINPRLLKHPDNSITLESLLTYKY